MNAEQLASIAGVVLSLAFSYVPGVKGWFEELAKGQKQALMGGLLIVVAGASFGLSCAGVVDVGVACTQTGAIGLVEVLVSALVANQGTYLITRK
jgi:hypothetical protein